MIHAEVYPVNAGKRYVKYAAMSQASVPAKRKKKTRVHDPIKKGRV